MRLLIIFTFLLVAKTVTYAQSQEQDLCNGLELFECQSLADRYKNGIDPFPKDLDLAAEIKLLAVKGAIDGCGGQNYNLCYSFKRLNFETPTPDPEAFNKNIELYKSLTEPGCEKGIAAACYWRSTLYSDYKVREFLVQQAIIGGENLNQLKRQMSEDRSRFQKLAYENALKQEKEFRVLCNNGDAKVCGDLGILIHSRRIPTERPFEQVDLLIKGCLAENLNACSSAQFAIRKLAVSKPSKEIEGPIKNSAIAKIEASCNDGKKHACFILSKVLNNEESDAFIEKSCAVGHGRACEIRGIETYFKYSKSGQESDLQKAKEYLRQACTESRALACHTLKFL